MKCLQHRLNDGGVDNSGWDVNYEFSASMPGQLSWEKNSRKRNWLENRKFYGHFNNSIKRRL